jgi:hypothetical protein
MRLTIPDVAIVVVPAGDSWLSRCRNNWQPQIDSTAPPVQSGGGSLNAACTFHSSVGSALPIWTSGG